MLIVLLFLWMVDLFGFVLYMCFIALIVAIMANRNASVNRSPIVVGLYSVEIMMAIVINNPPKKQQSDDSRIPSVLYFVKGA
jgi:hypothetical protein